MLVLEDVTAGYGPIKVLKGVSLSIYEGEIVCLLGANGAGKTTTLMTLSGVHPLHSGMITFLGAPIAGIPPHEVVQLGISHVPEGRRIFPRLTVMENLEMGAFTRRRQEVQAGLDQAFAYFPILRDRRYQRGGTLSGGEQQMLAIARALMARPRLLLLDEPSLGLAPIIVRRIFEIVSEINRQGVTILLVEQNAKAALRLAHRGYVMETGRIVLSDAAQNLLHHPKIREAYLGESMASPD